MMVETKKGTYACDTCGAVVHEEDGGSKRQLQHQGWHSRIEAAIGYLGSRFHAVEVRLENDLPRCPQATGPYNCGLARGHGGRHECVVRNDGGEMEVRW